MQTHILDPSHFPSLIPVTALLSFARERERERERERSKTQCQFGQNNSKRQIQDLKRMVHSTMLCCYSPGVIKEHILLF